MFYLGKNQFFTFTLIIILTILVKAQMDSDNARSQNQFNSDDSRDITDNDLKLALDDLSIDELKTLQEFIDSTEYNDLSYQENSFIKPSLMKPTPRTIKSNDFDNQKFKHVIEFNPDGDDYNLASQNNENDLFDYPKSQENFKPLSQVNQRAKRDDQMSNINDEYIKQLDYSFSQSEQQNDNNDDIELNKPHVRVKRD